MGTILINDRTFEVPDEVAKYVTDLEGDVKRALADSQSAGGVVKVLEGKVDLAVRDAESKVRAAEAKLMSWLEARAHSFFQTIDGDFRNVAPFLRHLTSGLDPHLQPRTIGPAMAQNMAQVVQKSPAAPAPAAPAPSVAAEESSASAPGSPA